MITGSKVVRFTQCVVCHRYTLGTDPGNMSRDSFFLGEGGSNILWLEYFQNLKIPKAGCSEQIPN